MFFCLCHERGTKEKLLCLQESPHHSKSPHGNSEFVFIPRSWQDEKKTSLSISLLSSKLTVSLILRRNYVCLFPDKKIWIVKKKEFFIIIIYSFTEAKIKV